MQSHPFSEVIDVGLSDGVAEVGGGHGQKGVDFQRYWVLMKMIELEKDKSKDFLILFETIQDIAIFDSDTEPKNISIYQIKKKDRKEWSWNELTDLPKPKPVGKEKTKDANKVNDVLTLKPVRKEKNTDTIDYSLIKNSPLGKLYNTVRLFKDINAIGFFVSNAGCDVPLKDGGNAATSLPVKLIDISKEHIDLLLLGIDTLHKDGDQPPDISKIYLERVNLPPDDPASHVIGKVHEFLTIRSPRHAGQARSLVESLMATISPLGAKTDSYADFPALRKQRGYSKKEFLGALGDLESVPDEKLLFESCLTQLQQEGVGFFEIARMRVCAAAIYRRQLMGENSDVEENVGADCDALLVSSPDVSVLRPRFDMAKEKLSTMHPTLRIEELLTHFVLRASKKCAALT